MELESHEHYEMLEDSFEKLKLGCLSSSKYLLLFFIVSTTFFVLIFGVSYNNSLYSLLLLHCR
jgi:hypothetical protein